MVHEYAPDAYGTQIRTRSLWYTNTHQKLMVHEYATQAHGT
jgi:hypothetical protein